MSPLFSISFHVAFIDIKNSVMRTLQKVELLRVMSRFVFEYFNVRDVVLNLL